MRIPALVGAVIGLLLSAPAALAQTGTSNPGKYISGCANTTGTGGTVVIAAQGPGVFLLLTTITAANTGASGSLITIQSDPAGSPVTLWQTIDPASGGSNMEFPIAVVAPPNKAVGFTAGTASTTQYVCMAGYKYP